MKNILSLFIISLSFSFFSGISAQSTEVPADTTPANSTGTTTPADTNPANSTGTTTPADTNTTTTPANSNTTTTPANSTGTTTPADTNTTVIPSNTIETIKPAQTNVNKQNSNDTFSKNHRKSLLNQVIEKGEGMPQVYAGLGGGWQGSGSTFLSSGIVMRGTLGIDWSDFLGLQLFFTTGAISTISTASLEANSPASYKIYFKNTSSIGHTNIGGGLTARYPIWKPGFTVGLILGLAVPFYNGSAYSIRALPGFYIGAQSWYQIINHFDVGLELSYQFSSTDKLKIQDIEYDLTQSESMKSFGISLMARYRFGL